MLQRLGSASGHPGALVIDHVATADDDGTRLRPPVSGLHLLLGDLPVLGFVGRDEVVNAAQPAIVFCFQAKRVVHVGANGLGLSSGNSGLHRLKDVRVDRGGQEGLGSHTDNIHRYHSSGIASLTARCQIGCSCDNDIRG